MNNLHIPGVVDEKTKVVVYWLAIVVVAMCTGVVVMDTGQLYELWSMVPLFPHTAVMQLPYPSVVL